MKLDRITSNPARMTGQPCVRDLRLTVRRVVELVALYPDRAELQREFPELDEEDIRQALTYAAASLDDRVVELDADFHAILAMSGAIDPSVIRIRIEGLRAHNLVELLLTVIAQCATDLGDCRFNRLTASRRRRRQVSPTPAARR